MVFERKMLQRRVNGAIWDVLSLNMCTYSVRSIDGDKGEANSFDRVALCIN